MPKAGSTPPGHKGVCVHIPDPMWRALKIKAMDEGTSLRAEIMAALERYIKDEKVKVGP